MKITTRLSLAACGPLLAVLAGCGGSPSATGTSTTPTASPTNTRASQAEGTSAPSGGDFCTQLRALVKWQIANGTKMDTPAFLAENARRYTAMEDVAPAEFGDTIAFFAKYAADPPSQAAQEPGFADQAKKLTAAAESCHIDLAQQ